MNDGVVTLFNGVDQLGDSGHQREKRQKKEKPLPLAPEEAVIPEDEGFSPHLTIILCISYPRYP
jgi:hypothetical protein